MAVECSSTMVMNSLSGWCQEVTSSCHYFLLHFLAPVWLEYEPVGLVYSNHVINLLHGLGQGSRDGHVSEDSEEYANEERSASDDDSDDTNLMLLDPAQWKVSGAAPSLSLLIAHNHRNKTIIPY